MKKAVIVFIIVLGVAIAAATLSSSNRAKHDDHASNNQRQNVPQTAARVPAHYEDVAKARPLKATLDPQQFSGKARRAYEVAQEIPETLAQLPCYCYCDQGFGHKSLHTCYEDDHSAHCSTCVDEALMAYQLQKEQKLSAAQIREKIIEKFSQ
jgi:hypothetical protein